MSHALPPHSDREVGDAVAAVSLVLFVVVVALLCGGCYAPQPGPSPDMPEPRPRPHLPVRPDRPDKPDVRPAGTIVAELADQIPANIETSDALVLVVQLLKDGGDWTEADSKLLDQRLPGITDSNRALTKDDAAALKGAK